MYIRFQGGTMRDVFGVSESAEMLGPHPHTLRRWLRQKKVRGVRLGGVWRIEGATIRDLRQNGTQELAESR